MKKNKGFANSYFEHYYYFDSKKTPYRLISFYSLVMLLSEVGFLLNIDLI
jgi:hypothetical protein